VSPGAASPLVESAAVDADADSDAEGSPAVTAAALAMTEQRVTRSGMEKRLRDQRVQGTGLPGFRETLDGCQPFGFPEAFSPDRRRGRRGSQRKRQSFW
jgi:hypothetical protein